MKVTLSDEEIQTVLEPIGYSKQHVREAPDTPLTVRQENLDRLDLVVEKLKQARR